MSANLALTMAQGGSRVCLVEADLRRPKVLDYLGLEGAVGLTDALIGRADVFDVIQPYGGTNLWVLGAGPDPAEPLRAARLDGDAQPAHPPRRRASTTSSSTPRPRCPSPMPWCSRAWSTA